MPATPPTPAERQAEADRWPDFRRRRHDELARRHGWLCLTGFHWLPAQPSPLPGLPGRWSTDGTDAVVEATAADGLADAHGPLDGRSVRTVAETGRVPWLTTAADGTEIELLRRGGRLAVRSRAATSRARETFQSVPCFDYDPDWVMAGSFAPYDDGHRVDVATFRADLRQQLRAVGEVTFEAAGATHRLVVTAIKYGWSVEFHDPTNGTETEAWRQLKIDEPDERGRVVMDFNRTINMWFAFTPYATCPRPTVGNVVSVPVRAGERRVTAA